MSLHIGQINYLHLQALQRLEKYVDMEGFLEKSLKINMP